MGCDIHLMAEHWDKEKKCWVQARPPTLTCPDCGGLGERVSPTELPRACWFCKGKQKRRVNFYEGRNYDAFAILADVRNGRGFAGIRTGDRFNPISEPRGVPDDASVAYSKLVEKWDGDGHSHSYLTLQELQEYDWEQVHEHVGTVGVSMYNDWWKVRNKKGAPNSWSGGIGGAGIQMVTNEEMERLITSGEVTPLPLIPGSWRDPDLGKCKHFTEITWQTTYREAANEIVDSMIPALQKIAARKRLKPDEIRITFFFDN